MRGSSVRTRRRNTHSMCATTPDSARSTGSSKNAINASKEGNENATTESVGGAIAGLKAGGAERDIHQQVSRPHIPQAPVRQGARARPAQGWQLPRAAA